MEQILNYITGGGLFIILLYGMGIFGIGYPIFILINLSLAMNHKRDTLANRFIFNFKNGLDYLKAFKILHHLSDNDKIRLGYRKSLIAFSGQKDMMEFMNKHYPSKKEIKRLNRVRFRNMVKKIHNRDYIKTVAGNRGLLKTSPIYEFDDGIHSLIITNRELEGVFELISRLVGGIVPYLFRKRTTE